MRRLFLRGNVIPVVDGVLWQVGDARTYLFVSKNKFGAADDEQKSGEHVTVFHAPLKISDSRLKANDVAP